MHALALISADSAVDDEALGGVLGVGDVVAVVELNGWCSGSVLADLVVLSVVGHGADTASDGVSGFPVDGEVVAGAVLKAGLLLGVLGFARGVVGADCATLGAVVVLLLEVLGVGGAPDAWVACQ